MQGISLINLISFGFQEHILTGLPFTCFMKTIPERVLLLVRHINHKLCVFCLSVSVLLLFRIFTEQQLWLLTMTLLPVFWTGNKAVLIVTKQTQFVSFTGSQKTLRQSLERLRGKIVSNVMF